ncbi:MAG TPA: hypothetical protein VGU72_04270 [Beijerinckiaceae bacterium]|jgi:hypothetical protein|nr:hypothetical protein [Beijerinckiaceae bacterium]
MKYLALALLIASASLMNGCATDPCAGWRPINPSRQDALTDGTADQVLSHNRFGAKQCGWLPPGGKDGG